MSDHRELARREALAVWIAAQAAAGQADERAAELGFDRWWSRVSRRRLRGQ